MSEAAGYSGTPLPRKLGVKPDSRVLLVGAPDGFALAPLPAGVAVHRRAGREPYDVVVAFCPDQHTLDRNVSRLTARITRGGSLWVAWPKKASGVGSDLAENAVRAAGLAAGLVDTKVCAIDAVWSGLRLVYRLRDR